MPSSALFCLCAVCKTGCEHMLGVGGAQFAPTKGACLVGRSVSLLSVLGSPLGCHGGGKETEQLCASAPTTGR